LLNPTSLLPKKTIDHSVYLKLNSLLVNLHAYKYSPIQKTKIENQVTNTLPTSIIIPSQSLFASLILLVKKERWVLEVLC